MTKNRDYLRRHPDSRETLIARAKVTVEKNMIPMNMFSQRSLDQIETLMRPNQSSREGFLNDDECVIDVCEADWHTVKQLRLSFDQFADKLEAVTKKARRKADVTDNESYWDIARKGVVVDGLKVTWTSYMGYQDCPCCHFNDKQAHWIGPQETLSDTDFTITNLQTNQQIFFSQLHIHLIRRHHFFEGHTKYRLDPTICAAVLELKPGVTYKPVYSSESIWQLTQGFWSGNETFNDYINHKDVVEFIASGAQKIMCQAKTNAWVLEDKMLVISDQAVCKPAIVEGSILLHIDHGIKFYERCTHEFVDCGDTWRL
jgi:hypothetical protein